MSGRQHVESIEAIHPAIEAFVENHQGEYVVEVWRMAEDGWCGWYREAKAADQGIAIALAVARTYEWLQAERAEAISLGWDGSE